MAWRDALRIGSLEGVEFRTQRAVVMPGRKVAEFDLPFDSEGVAHVDLGRAADTYEFDALFYGDDYHLERDAFLEIFDKAGPYLLIHPNLQTDVYISVRHGDISITESTDRGGLAVLTIRARKSRLDSAVQVFSLPDKASVPSASAELGDALATEFVQKFETVGSEDFVSDAAVEVLDGLIAKMSRINGSVDSILDEPSHIASKLDQLSQSLASLVTTPADLWAAVDTTMALIGSAFARLGLGRGNSDPQEIGGGAGDAAAPDRARAGLQQGVLETGAAIDVEDPPDAGTEARDQQRQNHGAVDLLMRANMLRHLADAAVNGTSYDSANAAREMATALAEALRGILEGETAGQEVEGGARVSLHSYRSVVRKALHDQAGGLVELTAYTPGDALPSCMIAYLLYGDAERAPEIEARNRISDPGLVPAGVALEVLAE